MLARIETQHVRVKAEGTLVLRAVENITVRHDHSIGLAGEVLWRKPIAETLQELRACAVGVVYGDRLSGLIALHARGEKSQPGKVADGQTDGLP